MYVYIAGLIDGLVAGGWCPARMCVCVCVSSHWPRVSNCHGAKGLPTDEHLLYTEDVNAVPLHEGCKSALEAPDLLHGLAPSGNVPYLLRSGTQESFSVIFKDFMLQKLSLFQLRLPERQMYWSPREGFLLLNLLTIYPEGPAKPFDVSGQKLSPHCLETIFDSQLPSPELSPKMPNCLSTTREGFFSSYRTTPTARVIVRQLRDKNCLAAIFVSRHQGGPLGIAEIAPFSVAPP